MSQSSARTLSRVDDLLNYDFCPWANRWVYWMKHPFTGVAVVGVTAGICGAFVAPQAWLLCAGLLMIGLIGLIWPAISIAAVRAEVQFERAWCEEGNAICVDVKLTNRLPIPIWGLSLHQTGRNDGVLVSFARVSGWRSTVCLWRFSPEERGRFPRSPLLLQTGFPFGVWTARREASVRGELLVLPKAVELDTVPALLGRGRGDEQYSTKRAGDAGDVMGTRGFRPGDSLRQIHWATTARTGSLVCTERQMTVQNTVSCYLDLDASHHTGEGRDSSLEWSIRVFAGICTELASQGNQVQAIFGRENMSVQSGVLGQRRLLSKLALIPAEGVQDVGRPPESIDIAVSTDRSVPVSAEMQVTLASAGFSAAPATASSVKPSRADQPQGTNAETRGGSRGHVQIRNSDDLQTNLRANWRRACHAVS